MTKDYITVKLEEYNGWDISVSAGYFSDKLRLSISAYKLIDGRPRMKMIDFEDGEPFNDKFNELKGVLS